MPRRADDIEIQDPPLEALRKQHSCVRRTCLSCLSFLLVLLGISLLILKFTLGPQTKSLKNVPSTITQIIPIYDFDNIDTIMLTEGKERSKGVEFAAFIPKLVIAPIILILDRDNNFVRQYRPDIESEIKVQPTGWKKFMVFMKTPVGDHRDQIRIDWHGLPTDAAFIREYYDTELKKRNFLIDSHSETNEIRQFTFSKESIQGSVYINDNPTTPETDAVSLTVNLDINKTGV